MRRNIALDFNPKDAKKTTKYNKIYLYTHWGAEGLEMTLANALDRARERWDDPSYLARIIFTDMTQDAGKELTGYGISPYIVDPEFPTLEVHLEEKTVNGIPYDEFISEPTKFSI